MNYLEKWKVLGDVGEGGQGKVHRVCHQKEYTEVQKNLRDALRNITIGVRYQDQQRTDYDELRKWLHKMLQMEEPVNQFALKVLHEPREARDSDLARERIKHEIEAMSKNLHSNLINLEDYDPDGKWFVSKFYSGGTLAQKLNAYKGNFLSVLKAARPIIEGVAKLHRERYVHRDIKPANIFVGPKDELILGDFGLISFSDPQHTRISDKYENVGSHDWMPAWAMGMRIDELRPTFDIFSLGKVLWAMTSGKHILRLWYFNREEFNVEKMFPNVASIKWANSLFEKCIVEEEKDCLPNADALLEEVDKTINIIERNTFPHEEIRTLQKEFELLKQYVDKLNKKVPPIETDRSYPSLSKVALAILDLYRQRDVTKLSLEAEIILSLQFKRIQIESAIDELMMAKMIVQTHLAMSVGYGGQDSGPIYSLTEKGKKYLAGNDK
jgi:serine/threonine protein kinase